VNRSKQKEPTEWAIKVAQARAYLDQFQGDEAAARLAAKNGDLIDAAQWHASVDNPGSYAWPKAEEARPLMAVAPGCRSWHSPWIGPFGVGLPRTSIVDNNQTHALGGQ
jgi:hypothetical protein